MDDNWRTAIGYICIALVFISWFGMFWVLAFPTEFTFKMEMDNNTKEAIESINYSAIQHQGNKGNLIVSDTPCETIQCPQQYQGVYTLAYCMICKDDALGVENE